MYFLIFSLPVLLIVILVCSIISYHNVKKKSLKNPDSFTPERLKKIKTTCIVSSVIAGTFLAILVGFYLLLNMAVAYM